MNVQIVSVVRTNSARHERWYRQKSSICRRDVDERVILIIDNYTQSKK